MSLSKILLKFIRCNKCLSIKFDPKKGQLIENSYVVKDDIEYAYSNVIPLWAFGLNY